MMTDIFSTFDPHSSMTLIPSTSAFLLLTVLFLVMSSVNLFPMSSRYSNSTLNFTDIIFSQLSRTSSKSLKGLSSIITPLFSMIILINLMGMIPYTFSLSSHLIMTLSLGLPLWLALILSSFAFNTKASIAHFLPDGAPDWLNPFLVLIETTSVLVRPLTLSFRLAANMTAGHIVLGLVGIYGSAALLTSLSGSIILLSVGIGYILFEFAICAIQAYIFCLLITLYSDDHAH